MWIASVIFHDPENNSSHIYSRLKEFTIVEWKSSLIGGIRLSEILLDPMGHTFYLFFIVFWALLLEWSSIYHIPQMFWPLIYQAKFNFNSVHVEESFTQDHY